MSYPISDHYDGQHFKTPGSGKVKSFFYVLKWRLTSQRAQWPAWIDDPIQPAPPPHVMGSALRVTWINHATVLLQTAGLNILTDPVWSKRAGPLGFFGPKRVRAAGMALQDLPPIDVVVISHTHYDHYDAPTIKRLVARDNPLFIVPLGVEKLLHYHAPSARVTARDWHETISYNDDLSITLVPAYHWSARTAFDHNETLWAGFIFNLAAGKIYFAGDTGYRSGKIFKQIHADHGAMRLALLPIGAYAPRWFMRDQHTNPREAIKIFNDVHAQHALAIHHGTFQLTDEAIDAPAKGLARALALAGIDSNRFRAPPHGVGWDVPLIENPHH